jgi:N-acetylneuraminic acid mutarotase
MNKSRNFFAFLVICLLLNLLFTLDSKPAFADSPSENTWQVAAPLPEAVLGARVAVVDGKIYVMGSSLNYMFDPATNTWTDKTPMPKPRVLFGMAVWQNKIYVIGGSSNFLANASNVVQVYDASSDTWETKQPIPTARSQMQANVVNGQIYVVGGLSKIYGFAVTNEVYNVANDSWSTAEPAPCDAYSYASAVCGSKIYIMGGYNSSTSVLIYDCAKNSWSLGAPMPTTVHFDAAGATTGESAPRRIYVVGGVADSNFATPIVQVYDPQTNTWALGAPMPSPRHSLGVAVVNDRLYAVGGDPYYFSDVSYDLVGNRAWYTHNEVYTPFGYGTPDPAYVYEHTPANVTVDLSLNATFTNSTVPLVFYVDKAVSWMGYSLDNQTAVTIDGNTTIANVTNGIHTLTVYANDTYGNYAQSQTINFTVAVPAPFPVLVFVAVTATLAGVIAAIGVVIYRKRRGVNVVVHTRIFSFHTPLKKTTLHFGMQSSKRQ